MVVARKVRPTLDSLETAAGEAIFHGTSHAWTRRYGRVAIPRTSLYSRHAKLSRNVPGTIYFSNFVASRTLIIFKRDRPAFLAFRIVPSFLFLTARDHFGGII